MKIAYIESGRSRFVSGKIAANRKWQSIVIRKGGVMGFTHKGTIHTRRVELIYETVITKSNNYILTLN